MTKTASTSATPKATVESTIPARSTFVAVLKQFSGYVSGQVVNTEGWKHTESLIESRFIERLDKDQAAAVVTCPQCKVAFVSQAAHPVCAPPAA